MNPLALEEPVELVADEAQTVRELLRDMLAEDPDPHSAAAKVDGSLDAGQREWLLHWAIHRLAIEVAASVRNHSFTRRQGGGSGKWTGRAQAARDHPDIFAAIICVGLKEDGTGDYRFLGDCDKPAMVSAAEFASGRAQAYVRRSEQYGTLAKRLRRGQTVRQLGRATVERIFEADDA